MGKLSSYTNTFAAGTLAKANEVNTNFSDIQIAHNATDTAALYKDGTKAMTGNLAMGSHKITGLANGTASGDAVNKSQLDLKGDGDVKSNGSVNFTALQSYFESTITDATNSTPIVITSEDHGRSDDDFVIIDGVVGNTAANGLWQITYIDEDSFSLNSSAGDGAYTSGGTIYLIPSELANITNKAYVDAGDGKIKLGTCSTASATAEKAVTLSDFVLITGVTIQVTFDNANTHATPTLNVNSTGAKSLKNLQGNALSYIPADVDLFFMYDGTDFIGIYTNTFAIMPDYANGVSKSINTEYTATADGLLLVECVVYQLGRVYITINSGTPILLCYENYNNDSSGGLSTIPINMGDVYMLTSSGAVTLFNAVFYPAKGAS